MRTLLFSFLLCSAISLSAQNVSFNATEACYGTQTAFVGSSTYADSDISQWLWDMDNDGQYDDAMGKMTNYFFSQPGTAQVGVKITLVAGGADSTSANVTVNPLPNVNFQVDNLCEGAYAVYIDQSTIPSGTINQYKWDFDNDGIFDDISGDTALWYHDTVFTYVTKLECVSDKNCSAFAQKTTQVYHQPSANFSTQNNCEGSNTVFVNNSTITDENISLLIWDFGDGKNSTTSGNAIHQYDLAQTYYVKLIAVSESFCSDTFVTNVTINPSPEITLSATDTVIYTGDETTISVEESMSSYLWNNGSTTSSITVKDSGTYSVTATDANGCTATESKTIAMKEIPDTADAGNDIITPNADGYNDVFVVKDLAGYNSCEIKIYNIWNEEVYSSTGYNNDWDGKSTNGKSLDAGAYFYILKCDDKEPVKGTVNILR